MNDMGPRSLARSKTNAGIRQTRYYSHADGGERGQLAMYVPDKQFLFGFALASLASSFRPLEFVKIDIFSSDN